MSIKLHIGAAVAAVACLAVQARAQGVLQLPPRAAAPAPAAFPFAAGPVEESTAAGLAVSGAEAFEVVPLKYADVSEIVGLLTGNASIRRNDEFTPEEPAFGSPTMQGPYPMGPPSPLANAGLNAAGAPTDSLGRAIDGTIGVDRRLNAIVLKGPPAQIAQLKAQIAAIDVPVQSVELETVFVELTESGARNVGIDFNNTNGQVLTASYALSQGDFPGVANTARQGGRVINMQAAIYAEIDKGEGRILSKPRISAQSGQTAKIVTGDALPILTSIALSGVNAVQQQVEYVNVGVTLQIAPRVSADGFVTSHIFTVVSSVTGVSQGYPTISQREASTSATVRDGQSFVIGGLTQESELSHHIKVPGVGDIPVLGRLFQSAHVNRSKTELYIVVTPHIARPGGARSG